MSSGASWWIWARSHLSAAVMNAETIDVDGVWLLWKWMEMNLQDAFSTISSLGWSLMCDFTTVRLVFHYSWLAGKGGGGVRQRGDRVGWSGGRRTGGAYLWQSLSRVAEHSVTYLMSFMRARNLLCVLRREAHNIIHNAWIHLFTGIKVTLREI